MNCVQIDEDPQPRCHTYVPVVRLRRAESDEVSRASRYGDGVAVVVVGAWGA